ncbi:MAG: hypothetical protein U1E25_14470 [Methylocystis sp.]
MATELERASARLAEPCLPARLQKPRLSTRESCEYLREKHGVRLAPATLNKYRCLGGGPLFEKFGATVLYKPNSLDSWALAKLGEPRSSTSEETHT